MILFDVAFYDANQDTVDEMVSEHGGRIVQGDNGGKPTVAAVFKNEIAEVCFYVDLVGLFSSESDIEVQ